MFERFEDSARRVVVLSQMEARLLRHEYIAAEHLLLGLCRAEHEGDPLLARAMPHVSLDDARARLADISPPSEGAADPAGHIPFTPDGKAVLEGSLREATRLGHERIDTGHLLLAVLAIDSGAARRLADELRIDADRVRSVLVDVGTSTSTAATSTAATGAAAPNGGDSGVLARLGRLEAQVAALTAEVAELRARSGDG